MKRYIYFIFLSCYAANLLLTGCVRQKFVVMDMVHHNPGEAMTESKFLDPSFLKTNEYGAKVFSCLRLRSLELTGRVLILLYFRILLKPGAGWQRKQK